MKKLLVAGLVTALGFCAVGESKADGVDTVINFSGQTALLHDVWNPIEVILGPGTYDFTPVKNPYPGAIYDGAYSFGNGFWSGGYNIAINDNDHITSYYAANQAQLTAADAFAVAIGGSFTLSEESHVYFGVADTIYGDNGGGISLHLVGGLAPVPEPEIYAMLGLGLGLMGWVSRRRKNQDA